MKLNTSKPTKARNTSKPTKARNTSKRTKAKNTSKPTKAKNTGKLTKAKNTINITNAPIRIETQKPTTRQNSMLYSELHSQIVPVVDSWSHFGAQMVALNGPDVQLMAQVSAGDITRVVATIRLILLLRRLLRLKKGRKLLRLKIG